MSHVHTAKDWTKRMNTPEVIDDIFEVWEKLETRHIAKISEDNIDRLARLLKGRVDWSDQDRPTLTVNPGHQYKESTFRTGDWIDNRGKLANDPDYGGWVPSGTYTTREGESHG